MSSTSLDDFLDGKDYNVPLPGIEDSILNLRIGLPKSPLFFGFLSAALAEVSLAVVPLYYSLTQPGLSGTRHIKDNIESLLSENLLYFVPGFIFGAALGHNKRIQAGMKRRERSKMETFYNFAFEHPEVLAVPAALVFYQKFNSYSVLALAPQEVTAGVAYAGDLFRSCMAGISAYVGITLLSGFLHSDSLAVLKNAALSRLCGEFGNYDAAIKYQRQVTALPSVHSSKNHARLGDLYLKTGKVLEAIDEYCWGLRKKETSSISSDIFSFPVSIFGSFLDFFIEAKYFGFFSKAKKGNLTPQVEMAGKIREGAAHLRNGNAKSADASFRDAIMLDAQQRLPHLVYSHFLYGLGMDAEGDKEQLVANRLLFALDEYSQELTPIEGTRNAGHIHIESVRL